MIKVHRFISPESIRKAWLSGIQSYRSFYDISINRSAFTSLTSYSSKTNSQHLEVALAWELYINQIDNKDMVELLIGFLNYYEETFNYKSSIPLVAKLLNELGSRQHSKYFINSFSSFVYLSIFHQSCIYTFDHKIDIKKFLKEYFNIIKDPYKDSQNLLWDIKKGLYSACISHKNISKNEFHQISDLDEHAQMKFSLYIFFKKIKNNLTTKETSIINSLFPSSEKVFYEEHLKNPPKKSIYVNGKNHRIVNNIDSYLQFISDILIAVNYYITNFELKSETKINSNANIMKISKQCISLALSSASLGSMDTYKGLVASLFGRILDFTVNKKGYGVLEHHGIKGLSRAFFLLNFTQGFAISLINMKDLLEGRISFLNHVRLDQNSIIFTIEEYLKSFASEYIDLIRDIPNKKESLGTALTKNTNIESLVSSNLTTYSSNNPHKLIKNIYENELFNDVNDT